MSYFDVENSDRLATELKASELYQIQYRAAFRGTRNALLLLAAIGFALWLVGSFIESRQARRQQPTHDDVMREMLRGR